MRREVCGGALEGLSGPGCERKGAGLTPHLHTTPFDAIFKPSGFRYANFSQNIGLGIVRIAASWRFSANAFSKAKSVLACTGPTQVWGGFRRISGVAYYSPGENAGIGIGVTEAVASRIAERPSKR